MLWRLCVIDDRSLALQLHSNLLDMEASLASAPDLSEIGGNKAQKIAYVDAVIAE